MRALALLVNVDSTAPVLASRAAMRNRFVPLTAVKSPPTKIFAPSVDAASVKPCALSAGAKLVTSAPVVMS